MPLTEPMAAGTPLLGGEKSTPVYGIAGTSVGASLGVLSECYSVTAKFDGMGDQRVSLDPAAATALIKEGYSVLVESNAGSFAGFSNEAYEAAGCKVTSRDDVLFASEVLFAIEPPIRDFHNMKRKVLVSWVGRLSDKGKAIVDKANKEEITLIDITAAPRITIAQKLDVLSSQAKVAGHRAVIEASHAFQRFHTGEMTAAGKFPPSKTFVLGCGVAGLAAIGTSKALGSLVSAWDVRDVSDQCHSMGAKWVTVDFNEDGAGAGGYAKESSDAFRRAQQETFLKVLKDTDIAITTAAIPGRASPLLITKAAVAAMKPGSVIVDLAAVGGGNCELTKKDESYTTANGVTIIGYTDLAARMANQSSAMYAQNMVSLLKHIQGTQKVAGLLRNIDEHVKPEGDIVVRSIVCCTQGKKLEMPPIPQPTPVRPNAAVRAHGNSASGTRVSPFQSAVMSAVTLAVFLAFVLGLGEGVGASLLTVFLLSGAAGYQAVWGVAHALHTPLMSVTNAISGMTAVGGLLLLEHCGASGDPLAKGLAMVAIALSAVNIVGGFLVSQRMLNLFRRGDAMDFSYMLLFPGLLLMIIACALPELRTVGDVVSGFLCIASIGALSSMSAANAGCKLGIIGVSVSLSITLVNLQSMYSAMLSLLLLAGGGVLGIFVGYSVSPIKLPQTVAAFHSLVGLAAMLTSIGSFAHSREVAINLENISALLGDFIGGITLTGSIIAFGKLNGNLTSSPISLPGKNVLNLLALGAFIILGVLFLTSPTASFALNMLWAVAILSMLMGWHLVASVGGGDMPVCVTVLNSYSGWALVAEGFLLKSSVLTIVGSLIGFSGAILTKIMCDAMNRDIFNVIFGGINHSPPPRSDNTEPHKEHIETSVAATAELLVHSKEVLVVPGYGMAMARAQAALGDLANTLRGHGVHCKFGVHPVAGRMPGQMNVLLAEAGVPFEWVLEMEEVNPDMENADVVLVVGANDVVNSAAQEIEGCAIWGMPVIEVWRSKKVIFCKRSMGGGYADLDNPVFYKPNTEMLLGDAKRTVDALAAKVRQLMEHV